MLISTRDCPFKLIAVGFLIGSVLCAYPTRSENEFTKSLDASQKLTYRDIQLERFHIYITSVFISLVTIGVFRKRLSVWIKVVLMFLLTASLYLIAPKTTYMHDHLKSDEQRLLLRKIYRSQQLKYYGSFTLAVVSAPFICK